MGQIKMEDHIAITSVASRTALSWIPKTLGVNGESRKQPRAPRARSRNAVIGGTGASGDSSSIVVLPAVSEIKFPLRYQSRREMGKLLG